jgi:hypothetical protein
VTGNCDDPFLDQVFSAGSYTLALTVYNNQSLDGSLADGFEADGNPGFTCAEDNLTGNFCDVTDPLFGQRTGDWALAFNGATAVTDLSTVPITSGAPEPATLPLIFGGTLAMTMLYRRRKAAR